MGFRNFLLFGVYRLNLIFNFHNKYDMFARKLNKNIKFINYIPFIVYTAFIQAAQMVSSSVIVMLMA